MLCASIAVSSKRASSDHADALAGRILAETYEACRCGKLELSGFPDFRPMVEAMRDCNQLSSQSNSDYKVCVVHPSGALLLKEALSEHFAEMEGYQEIVEEHNGKFNPQGALGLKLNVEKRKPRIESQ